jgi:CDP-diglyceride synthetase
MSFVLDSGRFYLIVLAIFALIGFARGWRREVISMAFIVPTVLFLYVGGANGLASFFLQRVPYGANFFTGGAIGPKSLPPPPSPNQVLLVAVITLIVAIIVGFLVSSGAQKSPGTAGERFLGIIPGLVEGIAIVAYISHLFASSPQITFGTATPNPNNIGSGFLIIFLVAIAALIIGLLVSRVGRGSKK